MTLIQQRNSREQGNLHTSFNRKVTAIGPVWFKTARKIYAGFLVNICRHGLTLHTRDLPEHNTEIVLSFQLPPSKYVFNLKAVVAWVSGGKNNDMPRGMGVRFIDLKEEDERHLTDYIGRFLVPEEV